MGYIEDALANKEKEIVRAISLFQKADDLYEQGEYKRAAEIFRMVASPSTPEDLYNWGVAFHNGMLGKPDYRQAIYYLKAAADQDYADAERVVSICYFNDLDGKKPDYEKAFYYAQKAASHNKLDGFFILGLIYYQGLSKEKNLTKAYECFEKATSKGWDYCDNCYAAHYIAGRMLYNGEGIEIDYQKAREHLQELDNRKIEKISYCSDAMFMLGMIYINGYGVPCDTLKAFEYFTKSEKIEEHDDSEYWLGILCLLSDSSEKKKLGIEWLKKSSEHGNDDATRFCEDKAELTDFLHNFKKLD